MVRFSKHRGMNLWTVLALLLVIMPQTQVRGQQEELGRRDLALYDYGGAYDVNPFVKRKSLDLAIVRSFIWEHLVDRRRGVISMQRYSKEAVPTLSTYFVEPDQRG